MGKIRASARAVVMSGFNTRQFASKLSHVAIGRPHADLSIGLLHDVVAGWLPPE